MDMTRETNLRKRRLKQYLALLTSQQIDLVSYHQVHYQDHQIGTAEHCSVCRQYHHLLDRIAQVKATIDYCTRN